jgi:Zn-dependent protease
VSGERDPFGRSRKPKRERKERPDPFLPPQERPDPFAPPDTRPDDEAQWVRPNGAPAPLWRPLSQPGEPSADQPTDGGARAQTTPHGETHTEGDARQQMKRFGGPLGVIALAIWKVGRIALVALGKVAILFKIPVLGSIISGAVSIGAYALLYGWTFGIGLVGSLLVHELGHVVQIRREGMPVKALNFVPFFGAYVLSERAQSDDQQARISIAGPIAGTLLAVILWQVAGDDRTILALAYTGFFLNLLNLLPVGPLDGGGVGRLFNSGWWLVIAVVLAAVWLASGEEFAAFVALSSILMAFLRRKHGFAVEIDDGIPIERRINAAALYVGVVAVCSFGMAATFDDQRREIVHRYGQSTPVEVIDHHRA